MINSNKCLNWAAALLLGSLAAGSLTSCDNNIIYDDLKPCEVRHAVRFKWDNNILMADAFSGNVTSVAIYVFDSNDKFVTSFSEAGERLAMQGYTLPIDGLAPGNYTFVAWCGLDNEGTRAEDFTVTDAIPGETTRADFLCRMRRDVRPDGTHHSSNELYDLYHGTAYGVTIFDPNNTDQLGNHIYDIGLKKDTNNVKIILQQLSGADVDVSKFTFTIEDDNGVLKDNDTLGEDEMITYHPHTIKTGVAGVDTDPSLTRGVTNVGVGIADLKISRLMVDHQCMLTVRNDKNEKVLSVPMIDYALLVKDDDTSQTNKFFTEQEYLDAQDHYSLTFFLDARGEWISSQILINGWTYYDVPTSFE